ncbi:MAG: hypothetical protein AVDCRST_MAG08-2954, partial [uncultured Acetobacteraceae bacterium]
RGGVAAPGRRGRRQPRHDCHGRPGPGL